MPKPTDRLGRKEPDDDHYRSRFPSRVPTNCWCRYRQRRVPVAHPAEAEKFYRALAGQKVRLGMEASGQARWFERLLAELQFELRIGDAAEIRTKRVRKHSFKEGDAAILPRVVTLPLELMDLRSAKCAVTMCFFLLRAPPVLLPSSGRTSRKNGAVRSIAGSAVE